MRAHDGPRTWEIRFHETKEMGGQLFSELNAIINWRNEDNAREMNKRSKSTLFLCQYPFVPLGSVCVCVSD